MCGALLLPPWKGGTMETEPQSDFLGLTRGLSGTQIKIIGVVMMVFDHLYQMFYTRGVPQWFTWIGRPVAPVFLFMCAEGFAHTRSKTRYLLRLLIAFEFMNIVSMVISSALPNSDIVLIFSIFGSLFFSALYMLLLDMLGGAIQAKKAGKATLAALLMMLPLAYGLMTMQLLASEHGLPIWALALLLQFIPNIMTVEGGVGWVLLGLLFYALRSWRLLQILPLALFGALFLALGSIEWLIVFASVPILLYNNRRGAGGTYFFYIFYPAHIYLLYIIAYLLKT